MIETTYAKEGTSFRDLNATRVIATTIGVFCGLFSHINHGIFEIMQGNTPTDGVIINAIGEAQRFWVEGMEPAFTLIPNYLLTGIMAIIVGICMVIWSIWFLPSKHGVIIYQALFVLSFLVGGGIGQAFLFIPACLFVTRMNKPLNWWSKVLRPGIRPFLSKLWVVTLLLATASMFITLEIGIFGYFPGLSDPVSIQNISMVFLFSAVILYIVTFIAGFGHELERKNK